MLGKDNDLGPLFFRDTVLPLESFAHRLVKKVMYHF